MASIITCLLTITQALAFTQPLQKKGIGYFGVQHLSEKKELASSKIVNEGDDEALDQIISRRKEIRNNGKVAVLICPAQFCVPADYESLIKNLKEENMRNNDGTRPTIGTCMVAPLPRTEWIKVAKQLPTKSFFDANLSCDKTLDWYFTAIEEALSKIFSEEGDDVNVALIGHSIGGWVARAYLGGLSGSSSSVYRLIQRQCSSFVTLGTPHCSAETALVDQTRGLLKEVENSEECSSKKLSERGINLTCVGSLSVSSNIFTTDVEKLVAVTSYLPLLGRLGNDVLGDGIIPGDLAFMEDPARKIEIEKCEETGGAVRHAHVLPTPWNIWDGSAPSLSLPDDFLWYGSPSVIGQWGKHVV